MNSKKQKITGLKFLITTGAIAASMAGWASAVKQVSANLAEETSLSPFPQPEVVVMPALPTLVSPPQEFGLEIEAPLEPLPTQAVLRSVSAASVAEQSNSAPKPAARTRSSR
jgi:hypothetical protein